MLMTAPVALKTHNGPNCTCALPSVPSLASDEASACGTDPSSNYDFALISERTGFDGLEQDWNDLFKRAGNDTQMFQTFNWLWHWCNHFLDEKSGVRLAIVTVRAHGRLVLVWPLVAERLGPVTRLAWMGEPVSQYGDVVIEERADSADILNRAWHFLIDTTKADIAQLRKVRADAKVAPLLRDVGAATVEPVDAPYLDLTRAQNAADYERKFPHKALRNRKRQRRRIEERGPVSLDYHASGSSARDLSAVAIALKQTWLRERGLMSAALGCPATAAFFADVAEATVRPAGCHVMALRSNGAPAAIEIGVSCKGRTALHIIVYDLAFEKVGAGAVLMEDSIRRAYRDGVHTFDLLAPGDGYKLDWADATTAVSTALIPLTPLGWIYGRLYFGMVRGLGKKLMNSLPIAWRRRLASQVVVGLAALRGMLVALSGGA